MVFLPKRQNNGDTSSSWIILTVGKGGEVIPRKKAYLGGILSRGRWWRGRHQCGVSFSFPQRPHLTTSQLLKLEKRVGGGECNCLRSSSLLQLRLLFLPLGQRKNTNCVWSAQVVLHSDYVTGSFFKIQFVHNQPLKKKITSTQACLPQWIWIPSAKQPNFCVFKENFSGD